MDSLKKFVLYLFIVAGSIHEGNAQRINVPQNAVLRYLLKDTVTISTISLAYDPIALDVPDFSKNFQQLIKHNGSLYLFIDGTGRIYKALNWDDQHVIFERIDSTVFFGYNKGSQKIIYEDSIFSFGGYGFWHYNGVLSYFTKYKEWEVLQLNAEIPFFNINDRISSISYYDPAAKSVYFSPVSVSPQTLVNGIVNDSFYVLDVQKRQLTFLGISNYTKEDKVKFSQTKQIQTPWGILFDSPFDDNRDFILDIKNNQIFSTEDRIIKQLVPSAYYSLHNVFFYHNGYLFVSSKPYNQIDSIRFDFSKFQLQKKKLYRLSENKAITDKQFHLSLSEIIIFSFILSAFIFLLYYFLLARRVDEKNLDCPPNHSSTDVLTGLEKELLREFLSKIDRQGSCSTVELNSLLGVSSKSNEVKKKARTDFITKVNRKLMDHFSSQTDILWRVRCDDDKRSFLYTVDPERINRIKELI